MLLLLLLQLLLLLLLIILWTIKTKVAWLVVTEVQSESFGLATGLRYEIGVLCAVRQTFAYWTSLPVMHVIFFIVECRVVHFICAVRTLDVLASFSRPRLPLCQISFPWRPPLLS